VPLRNRHKNNLTECRKNGPVPTRIRIRAIAPWCILVMLVVLSQPTFAQYSEDYVDIPLFNVVMDATFKDCEALQQRVSRRATEREQEHSTCPRNTASQRPPYPMSHSANCVAIRRSARPSIRRGSCRSVVSSCSRRLVPHPGSGPTGKQIGVSFRSVALPTVFAVS